MNERDEEIVHSFQDLMREAAPGDAAAMLNRAVAGMEPNDAAAVTKEVADTQSRTFDGVTAKQRFQLYLVILGVLGALALAGLILGTSALLNGKESAAYFTFAGLALGGITGILVPAPGSGS